MKQVISTLLVIMLFSCASTKNIGSHSSPKIKKITEATHYESLNLTRELALKDRINTITFYNKNGTVTETHHYLIGDSVSYLEKKEMISLNEDDKPISGHIYDKEGQLTQYWISKFDKNNNVVEYKKYNAKDSLIGMTILTYDDKGNEIEEIEKNASGEVKFGSKSKYNSKNQLIENQGYSASGEYTELRIASYDEKGNVIEHKRIRADGRDSSSKSEFDEKNNITRVRVFDKDGNQTQESSYDIKYDEYGNWITVQSIHHNQIFRIYERDIVYYD